MNKFNVGDRVRVIGAMNCSQQIGKVTSVIGHKRHYDGEICTVVDLPSLQKHQLSDRAFFSPCHLELIPPDDDEASWDAIERITGWTPTGVTV